MGSVNDDPLKRWRVKYWEIIADSLKKQGWSLGWVATLDCKGRTIWIVDAHRGEKRFVLRSDEKLTAFVELESAIRRSAIVLDEQARVSQYSPLLNGSESGGGTFPR